MARSRQIVIVLKKQLRKQGISYKKLAEKLNLSESTIKQMFAKENFSLSRLDEICEVLNTDISELVMLTKSEQSKSGMLSIELEETLTKDTKLLLVAYCLINHWKVDEILERYRVSNIEIIRLLNRLDRMKIIELLPNNKVRLRVTNNFKWQPNGPIERYFSKHVITQFFNSNFDLPEEHRIVKNGVITETGCQQLQQKLDMVGRLFDDISDGERSIPSLNRKGFTMILAYRHWEYPPFEKYIRE